MFETGPVSYTADMLRTLACLLLLGVAAPNPTARDSWMPFANKRIVAQNGVDYVVIKETGARGDRATFEIARAAKGSAAVAASADFFLADKTASKAVVRKGDQLLARGVLPHLPIEVHLSQRRDGFVTVDTYYRCGYGKVLNSISQAGKLRFSKTLDDLFAVDERAGFFHTVSSYHWLQYSWLDEDQGLVFLAAISGLVKVVGIQNGATAGADRKTVLKALDVRDCARREELLGHALMTGLVLPPGMLHALMKNAKLAEAVRIRAATGLAAQGVDAGREFLLRRMFLTKIPADKKLDIDDRLFRWVGIAFGDGAVPLMREIHGYRALSHEKLAALAELPHVASWFENKPRRPAGSIFGGVDSQYSPFVSLTRMGRKGRAYLLELLACESDVSVSTRALHALTVGTDATVLRPVYDYVFAHPERMSEESHSGHYLARVGGKRFGAEMRALLRKCGPGVSEVYPWFSTHRTPAAWSDLLAKLAAQKKALEAATRTRKFPTGEKPLNDWLTHRGDVGYATRDLLAALRFQTGQSFGMDVAAWRKWVRAQRAK